MKKLYILALVLLTACYAAKECSTPINEMPQPEVLSAFYPGDRVIVTFPDDSTLPGQVVAVGGIKDFEMPTGETQKSRLYIVECYAVIDGEDLSALLQVPEFGMRLVE